MARTDVIWKSVGTYIRTTFDGGKDVLIAGVNRYLNFGSTSGSDGYGFRDNSGQIQVKHDGGSWANVGSGDMLAATYDPANKAEQVLTISDASDFATAAQGVLADSALQNIVEDTTPQLGGNLDVQANSITTSTVNGDITLTPNGTGNIVAGTLTFDGDQTVGAGQDNYILTYDNGTGIIQLEAPAAQDHGSLIGLSDDDHTQYALLAGRSGGQTIIGGTGTTDDLTFQTTSGVGATGADMHFKVGNNGATEALTILNNGNVGIGTTTPSYPLNAYRSSSGTTASFDADGNSAIRIARTNATQPGVASLNVINNGNLITSSDGYMTFNPGNAERMRITSTGNVGIGTTGPIDKLDVKMTTDEHIVLRGHQNFSSGATISSLNDANSAFKPLEFQASSFDFTQGNVGIGTTGPGYPLDVAGAVNTRTLLHFGGNSETGFTSADHPVLYSTGAGGAAYPFQTAGNLVLQSRTSGAARDIVFVGNTTPAAQMVIQGSTGNVGIGTTAPDYKLDINGALGLRATTTPADPDSGAGVVYMDSTTGDLMTKLNFGGTTKTVTLVDWSVV